MKKSLIALAALATVATAAQAQSSVSVYGVIDAGVVSATNTVTAGKRATGLANGGLSTPRLGFRGTEDLGGGLKANFNLEAEFLTDTGSQSSAPDALFARRSLVGLEGGFGRVDLGRTDTLGYGALAKFDGMGGNNVGGAVATGGRQARVENGITYLTPKFSGVQVGLQTGTRGSAANTPTLAANVAAFGEVAGEANGNRINSASASYDQGPLELAAIYSVGYDQSGNKLNEYTYAFARYDFGVARVVGGYVGSRISKKAGTESVGVTPSTVSLADADTKKLDKYFVGVNVPVPSTAFTINGQIELLDTVTNLNVKRSPMVYTAGANYALSKRTTAYALYSVVNQDNGSNQGIVDAGKLLNFAGASGKDRNVTMIGVRHTF